MTEKTLTLLEAAKKALNIAERVIRSDISGRSFEGGVDQLSKLEDVRAAIAAEEAHAKKVAETPRNSVTLTGYALEQALNIIAPDRDPGEMDCPLTIAYFENGHSGPSYYAYCDDCPEDGCEKLDDEPNAFNKEGDGKYLIWSNEYRAWFREERLGYCTPVAHAGRYSRDEAIAICKDNRGNEWPPRGTPPRIPVRERDIAACDPPADTRENFRQMTSRDLLCAVERELGFIARINVTAGFNLGDHSGWDINLMNCELMRRLGVPYDQLPVQGPEIRKLYDEQ